MALESALSLPRRCLLGSQAFWKAGLGLLHGFYLPKRLLGSDLQGIRWKSLTGEDKNIASKWLPRGAAGSRCAGLDCGEYYRLGQRGSPFTAMSYSTEQTNEQTNKHEAQFSLFLLIAHCRSPLKSKHPFIVLTLCASSHQSFSGSCV